MATASINTKADCLNYENFIIERIGEVVVLRINRPKALNALNRALLLEWEKILADTELRASKVLVITGSGEKAFIAGADISEMHGMSGQNAAEFGKLGQRVSMMLEEFPCPVIAAVNGFALGGGCEMAISCDMVVASDTAVFGLPEVSLGLIPGFGGTVRLARWVGLAKAKELIFTGRKITAAEALSIGLTNKVVAREKLIDEAVVLGNEIIRNSVTAVRSAKASIRLSGESATAKDGLDIEARHFRDIFGTGDQIEGTTAFLEKRAPKFKGV